MLPDIDIDFDNQSTNVPKVFCSQSVVLMLRYALDAYGKNLGLLKTLHEINSRLVSPKQVCNILQMHGRARIMTNEELNALATTASLE